MRAFGRQKIRVRVGVGAFCAASAIPCDPASGMNSAFADNLRPAGEGGGGAASTQHVNLPPKTSIRARHMTGSVCYMCPAAVVACGMRGCSEKSHLSHRTRPTSGSVLSCWDRDLETERALQKHFKDAPDSWLWLRYICSSWLSSPSSGGIYPAQAAKTQCSKAKSSQAGQASKERGNEATRIKSKSAICHIEVGAE